MIERIISQLAAWRTKQHSQEEKVVAIFFGVILFLFAIPWVLLEIGVWVTTFLADMGDLIRIVVGAGCAVVGLFFLGWSVLTFWKQGDGTPAPMVPPQRLVRSGPYRCCRNPMQLGAVLFWFGLGLLQYGVIPGVVAGVLGLCIGTLWHRKIEEKELEAQFGDAYLEYKRETPFLFPRVSDISRSCDD